MYLRTTQRKNADGSVVRYYQLAHNTRDPESGLVSAQIIHNFGRADQLDREALVRLCTSIARVCDVEVVDRQAREAAPVALGGRDLPADVDLIRTRQLGIPHVAAAIWEELGVPELLLGLLKKDGLPAIFERALFAMVANRLDEPESKLGLWDRWLENAYVVRSEQLELRHLYEAMDVLYQHAATVEHKTFNRLRNLFNLEVDVVFFDTTTACFEIDDVDPDSDDQLGLRKRGLNKEGGWRPQVVIALAVTRDGFPVRSWVFPGNTVDATVVPTIRRDLKGWRLGRCMFVGDAGMNSVENKGVLTGDEVTYLMACRTASVAEIREQVLTHPGRFQELADNLRVKEVQIGDGPTRRRYFLCHNPHEEKRQQLHREQVLAELRKELASHADHRKHGKWAMELICSRRFGRYLTLRSSKGLVIDPAKVREAARHDGRWVLVTNDWSITAADAAHGYKALGIIERCFRNLKSTQIHLTPMHHWLPRRIEAHVKICVLALLIQRIIESRSGTTWRAARKAMQRLQVTELTSASHRFFRTNQLHPDTRELLEKLKIAPPKRLLAVTPRT